MSRCAAVGCDTDVSHEGHQFCYAHWRALRDGALVECETCRAVREKAGGPCRTCCDPARDERDAADGWLSSGRIGERVGCASRRLNRVLSELGWIQRHGKGWAPTALGAGRGAVRREVRQTGVPFVVWPAVIAESPILLAAVREIDGADAEESAGEPGAATLRAADGHLVRSRAELRIDNFLYSHGIAHAYDRRVPVDEDLHCDFYLPSRHVYVEHWSADDEATHAERRERKLAVYTRYELKLVEVADHDVADLDESLLRKLARHGFECD